MPLDQTYYVDYSGGDFQIDWCEIAMNLFSLGNCGTNGAHFIINSLAVDPESPDQADLLFTPKMIEEDSQYVTRLD